MRKLVKQVLFGTALSLWSVSLWQIVNAQGQAGHANLVSAPFIAADRSDTPDFVAQVGSTGKRSPYILRTNVPLPREGTYNGLIIKPENPLIPVELDNLSFSYKGSSDAAAVVHYNYPPSRGRGAAHLGTSSVAISSGTPMGMTKDGFKKVSFTARQLGLPSNNVIQKIVLAPPAEKKSGRFMVDDLSFNMAPVNKAMESLFFSVQGASATGPIGNLPKKINLRQSPYGTSLSVRNATTSNVVVWLTLPTVCTPNSSCLLSVQNIFSGMTCASGCFQGSQTLTPGQVITYQPAAADPPSIQGAIISFNSPPTCGIGNYEFTINNNSQGVYAQETVNISLVNGNNASGKFTLDDGTGADWTTNFGLQPYKQPFQNYSGNNFGVIGVFPFGCTNCTFLSGSAPCGAPSQCTPTGTCQPPDPQNCPQFCSFQRSAGKPGGTVLIDYLGPPQAMPTKTGLLNKILWP